MTQDELIQMLYQKVRTAGSQKKLAKLLGVTPSYLGDILHGRRDPGKLILSALKLERIVRYEKQKVNQ